MPYLKLFNHEGKSLTETILSNPPIPRIGEEIVLEDGVHYTVKRVVHDIARSPQNGLYLGAEVTVHALDIVTCEFCKTPTKDSEVKYPMKYGGGIKCLRPSEDPAYKFCGGRLFYANGKQCDRPINPTK